MRTELERIQVLEERMASMEGLMKQVRDHLYEYHGVDIGIAKLIDDIRNEPSDDCVDLPCLFCGKMHRYSLESNEANDIFNVFCAGGECEENYAATL